MIHLGDSVEVLKTVPENSIDAVVTDPPYGLSFMGKKWDYDVPSVELWREVFRVLKPGGHLLSFGGTRTYHRMAVNIEDAGFEIRDQIQWIYGSGFPKSHNIKDGEFKGWGTALKPANEPICVARKLLEKGLTVVQNVQKWGTGALNIDASRIEAGSDLAELNRPNKRPKNPTQFMVSTEREFTPSQGRWPANLILNEAAAEMLDVTRFGDSGGASRFFYVAKASKRERNAGLEGMSGRAPQHDFGTKFGVSRSERVHTPTANNHPTVKPVKLMEYLVRLVTPPNGTVLDPFMGSGATGVACKRLGFRFTGIEIDPEYVEIAKRRIDSLKREGQLELEGAS